jgi:thiamine kinase-like enzyme
MHAALDKFDDEEICQKTLKYLCTKDWKTHPATCHGDLTLENMIVKDGKVYLIDFLDAFHDCLEVDMAKMMQDLCCMWSFRHETLSTDGILFLQECAHHVKMLYRKITNSDEKQLQAMLQLTLLRIYPYLKDKKTKLFLDTELQVLL